MTKRFGIPTFVALAAGLCACGDGWQAAQPLEAGGTLPPGTFFYFGPKVAAYSSVFGSAAAVWTSRNTELHASDLGLSWSAPAVFADHRSFRHAHAVAVGGDGSAIALFTSSTGLSWARRASGAWGSAASLGEPGSWPGIAADRSGNMVGVWTTGTRVRAARYLVAGGWQPAESLGAEAVSATSPDVSVSASGYAVAAWCERRSTGTSWIVANRYVPATGWTGATDLGSVPECLELRGSWREFAPDPSTVDTAIDELNVAAVVWTNGAVQFQRYARHFDGTSSWTAPIALSTGADDTNPQIAVNRDGDAIAAWQTANGDLNDVQANRYSAEFDRWGGVSTISGTTSRPPNLAVGMASSQHGMVAYLDGRQQVTATAYDGARFGSAQTLSDIGSYEFDMVMTADGQACAVWAARNIDVFAATFTP